MKKAYIVLVIAKPNCSKWKYIFSTTVNFNVFTYLGLSITCNVRMTILPRAAHWRRYSTRKNVSNMSIPLVGRSNTTMSASSSRWQATFKRCFSETVKSFTLVCRTCARPRSSTNGMKKWNNVYIYYNISNTIIFNSAMN